MTGYTKNTEENQALLELREYAKNQPPGEGLVPLKDFFKNAEIQQVQLSPDGKYLAYLKAWEGRMNIHVRPVDKSAEERRITKQKDRDIPYFFWKENSTLLFLKDEGGDENDHIFRVFANGEGEKDLTSFTDTKVELVDDLDNISEEEILIGMNKRNKEVFDVYRLNIKTGDMKMVAENPGHFISWMTDHRGKLRVALSAEGTNKALYCRGTEEEPFDKIITYSFKDSVNPYFFTFDNKNLYMSSSLDRDKSAVVVFDPRQKKEVQLLFSHPQVDVGGLAYSKKRKVLTYIAYSAEKLNYHFLDSETENIFKELKAQFLDKNIRLVSNNREETLMVVHVGSDRNPGSYYLFNVLDKSLSKIADTRPWLKEETLAEMTPLSYKARDGLTVPAYLTKPKGAKGPLPLVVHPHGGPGSRDHWGYSAEVQFLVSRGYAVFQMNFRGSVGYGKKFWQAGWKQWGRAMQDDVTDGVKYLIEKGVADKDKVAIFGGSYGGYVVLAGLTFTPDLYACGVDYVGVSNMFTLLKTVPPYWKPLLEWLYEMEGHPEKDKELLRAISPVFHADRIKAPLFVVQGANDPRVKKSESDQIVKALEDRGVAVPYLVKENEGHGFRNEENRLEFYALMEAFLRKHLG